MEKTYFNCGTPITKEYCEGWPEVCEHWTQKKPQTNADRIRVMRDEELAMLLLDGCRGSKCSEQPQNEYGSVNCFECRLGWLKQSVKDGEN